MTHAFPSPVDPKTGKNQLGLTIEQYMTTQFVAAMLSNPCLFDTNGEFQEDNIKVAHEMAKIAMEVCDGK
jgi:hypothetical protein